MRSTKRQRLPPLERLSPSWTDFELIDTGSGRKLERFGPYTLIRPEPQATWPAALSEKRWSEAGGAFIRERPGRNGAWKFSKPVPSRWRMRRNDLEFWVEPTLSGHVGVFPDQACHWDWISAVVAPAANAEVLCLFGYTGLATLSAAAAGARVTHIDASRKAVKWARENQCLSGLSNRPIRWIVDDALKFVAREVKRGHKYHGLILDPPRFGRGPGGEMWRVQESLPHLLGLCRDLLSPAPLFVLLNTYTSVLTQVDTAKHAISLHHHLRNLLAGFSATISAGELVLADSTARQLSASVFARAVITKDSQAK